MASSKKYGYQLRGEKLSLCELDITGSGSGLNYSYEENAGLDISTDPSAWKSPLTTITDGLQIEYLSNEFIVQRESSSILSSALEPSKSRMTNIDDVYDHTSAALEGTNYNLTHPLVFTKESGKTQSDGTSGDVLKVSKLESTAELTGIVSNAQSRLSISRCNLNIGERYEVSMDIYMNCQSEVVNSNSSVEYVPRIEIIDSPDTSYIYAGTFEALSPSLLNNILHDGKISHPRNSSDGSWHTGWANFSFEFIATSDYLEILIRFPNMDGTVDDVYEDGSFNRYIYIDNLHVSGFGDTQPDNGEISLPSYAQKALLDYVRAQDSYENGDLEKWDFFMKQFRSKLERWEDSRITGPRVLGPHGPSSIT